MEAVLLGLIGLTSIGLYIFGRKRLSLSGPRLAAAAVKTLECVGAALVFFGFNLSVAVLGILAIRKVTGIFVSLYPANDVVWLIFSFLQGVTFQWWRELSKKLPRQV